MIPFLLQAQALVHDSLAIRHVPPSVILDKVLPRGGRSGLIPLGVSVEPDDSRRIIHLSGTAKGVAEAEKMIALYDVEGTSGRFEVVIESPRGHEECTASVVLRSWQTWSMTDEQTHTTVKLQPRFDNLGRATLLLGCKWTPISITTKFTLKTGESYDSARDSGKGGSSLTMLDKVSVVRVKFVSPGVSPR